MSFPIGHQRVRPAEEIELQPMRSTPRTDNRPIGPRGTGQADAAFRETIRGETSTQSQTSTPPRPLRDVTFMPLSSSNRADFSPVGPSSSTPAATPKPIIPTMDKIKAYAPAIIAGVIGVVFIAAAIGLAIAGVPLLPYGLLLGGLAMLAVSSEFVKMGSEKLEVQELTLTRNQLQSEIENDKTKLSALETEKNTLTQKKTTNNPPLTPAETARLNALPGEIDALTKQIKTKQDQSDHIQAKIDNLENKPSSRPLSEEVGNLERGIPQLEEQIAALKRQRQTLGSQGQGTMQQVQGLTDQINQLEGQLRQMQDRLNVLHGNQPSNAPVPQTRMPLATPQTAGATPSTNQNTNQDDDLAASTDRAQPRRPASPTQQAQTTPRSNTPSAPTRPTNPPRSRSESPNRGTENTNASSQPSALNPDGTINLDRLAEIASNQPPSIPILPTSPPEQTPKPSNFTPKEQAGLNRLFDAINEDPSKATPNTKVTKPAPQVFSKGRQPSPDFKEGLTVDTQNQSVDKSNNPSLNKQNKMPNSELDDLLKELGGSSSTSTSEKMSLEESLNVLRNVYPEKQSPNSAAKKPNPKPDDEDLDKLLDELG